MTYEIQGAKYINKKMDKENKKNINDKE